jgi:hypothetical protein
MIEKDQFIDYCVENCFSNPAIEEYIALFKYGKDVKLPDGSLVFQINGRELKILKHTSGVDQLRLNSFLKLLDKTISKYNLNLNFKFILNTRDEDMDCVFPAFQFSRNTEDSKNILIPDPHLLDRYLGKTECNDSLFKDKINKCIFRGSDTGKYPNALANSRIYACNKFKNSKTHDFKISNFISFNKEILEYYDIDINNISGEYLSPKDQLKYKYIADMDGNTIAWDRNCWALPSNSILIKYQFSDYSEYETWYSKYMYENSIVPRLKFHEDLSQINLDNLLEKQKSFTKIFLNEKIVEKFFSHILVNYNFEYNK